MRTCGDECSPYCDFCLYFNFNGDAEGRYLGKGFCKKHQKPSEPYHSCEDFDCTFREFEEA